MNQLSLAQPNSISSSPAFHLLERKKFQTREKKKKVQGLRCRTRERTSPLPSSNLRPLNQQTHFSKKRFAKQIKAPSWIYFQRTGKEGRGCHFTIIFNPIPTQIGRRKTPSLDPNPFLPPPPKATSKRKNKSEKLPFRKTKAPLVGESYHTGVCRINRG